MATKKTTATKAAAAKTTAKKAPAKKAPAKKAATSAKTVAAVEKNKAEIAALKLQVKTLEKKLAKIKALTQ